MMHHATRYHRDVLEGRWVIVTSHRKRRWEVIIEPDLEARLLVVVTAYPVSETDRDERTLS